MEGWRREKGRRGGTLLFSSVDCRGSAASDARLRHIIRTREDYAGKDSK